MNIWKSSNSMIHVFSIKIPVIKCFWSQDKNCFHASFMPSYSVPSLNHSYRALVVRCIDVQYSYLIPRNENINNFIVKIEKKR